MLGGHSGLEPPLPISNRAVKRTSANDSMLFACESRSLPSYSYQTPLHEHGGVFLFVLPEKHSLELAPLLKWNVCLCVSYYAMRAYFLRCTRTITMPLQIKKPT